MATKVKVADIFAALRVDGVTQYDQSMDKVEERARKAAEQVAKVGQAMLAMGAAITAVAGLAVREAAQFETLEVRLQAIFNNTEKGTAAFRELQKVAAKTPFSLQGVVQAGATLAAYMGQQKDKAVELTVSIADLAAFMGDDIPLAASAFGRAFAAGAGAADMLRERGVLALLTDFARMKYGIQDLTRVTLPEFRKILIEAIKDPSLGIAGSTERLSKTFAGAMSNMKDALSQLAAAFGKELLPALTGTIRGLTSFLEWFNKIPPEVKALIAWGGTLVGILATLAGGFLTLLPRILDTTKAMRALHITITATKAGLAGAVAIIASAAAATYAWTTAINKAYLEANKNALNLNRLARAARTAKKDSAEYYDAMAAWYEAQVMLGKGSDESLDKMAKQAAKWREMAAAMRVTTDNLREFNELAFESNQAWQATLDRITEGALQVARGISPEQVAGDVWQTLPLDKLDDKVQKTIDWMGALQQAAGAAGQSLGQAFSDMAAGAEMDLGKVIEQIGKLIAKLLIMAALYTIPGVGPLLAQFAGGFLGGVGFENPVEDTKAFRWGFDFARQFREGINASITGGLSLPSMQPAAVTAGGFAGGIAFDVHVHEPGPYTQVEIVRRGIEAMSDQQAFGLFRTRLGRATDKWAGR